ncbi:ankyrin repeat domain-containing protein [Bradyrhizobium tropiciagri]|uniref:ankyrin repeat domain-containing protein n=1 Tax=Bradyrhizobium tropiciagri TaxID=312253 RepID=UPI000B087598|nr:hypothetical protein [Bradyrhizobium tropiciagri]
MTTDVPRLRNHDPLAVELTAAVKAGEAERLRAMLAAHPELARCVVVDAKGGGRSPLHLLADWPGHNPNAAAIVQILAAAGADLDAPAAAMWHRETPLHWAASSDDVALIDALLDAGATSSMRAHRSMAARHCRPPSATANGRRHGGWSSAARGRRCGRRRRWA